MVGKVAYRAWEEELTNYKGWMTWDEIRNILPGLHSNNVNDFLEYVEGRDKIKLRKTNRSGSSSYYVEPITDNPYKKYKEKIPEETHDIFHDWVGKGRSPSVTVALIQYLTDKDTDVVVEVAEEHGITSASIYKNKDEMIEDLLKEGIIVYA